LPSPDQLPFVFPLLHDIPLIYLVACELAAQLNLFDDMKVDEFIMEAAAKSNLKRVSLELGGKSPIVVFPDVDRNECLHFY
jgi:hypothetical protein